MYLSVVIPAYNEEKRITKTLVEIDAYLKNKSFEYEIIVVNDGSQDKTIEVVKNLQSRISHLQIIDNTHSKGKGFVVRKGLLKAKGDWRLFTDADNSTPINQLEKFLPLVGQYDILIGSRSSRGSEIVKAQPLHRIILGKCYGFLVKTIVNLWGFHDTQCGFKLFSKKSTEDILPRCKTNGLSSDAEILIIAKKLGYRIREIPVVWADDKETKVNFYHMMKALLDVLLIRMNLWRGAYRLE